MCPVEMSQTAKKQMTYGATSRNRMLASRQNSLKALHSDEIALLLLGAHTFFWMNYILEVSPSRNFKIQ